MNVKLLRSYRSKNGNPTFVYAVSGNQADLDAFKEAQGEYYREDDKTGSPLWFTTRCIGNSGTLIITTNGNIVPDMSKFDQASSIASQYGGNLGAELARASAMAILGLDNQPAPAPAEPTVASAPASQEAPASDDEDELS